VPKLLGRPDSHKTPQKYTKSHFNRSLPLKQGESEKISNEIKDLDRFPQEMSAKKVLMK
jgi:hypothetical protein